MMRGDTDYNPLPAPLLERDQISPSSDSPFARHQAQSVLFAARPSRLALQRLELTPDPSRMVSVNVWRNHSVETVLGLTLPYIAYGSWSAGFCLGDYDDSLLFAAHGRADIELLWLDSSRYGDKQTFGNFALWLDERLGELRAMTTAPIVLATWMATPEECRHVQALTDAIPAVYFADLGAACAAAGVALIDQRTAAMAGSPVGNAAQAILARELACRWLPGALFPPIKAVVFDLDHTLHAGVLAEDGIYGVELTPAHRDLQQFARALRARGIFIALASRNQRADVEALFRERDDYPLRWDEFSATEISWDDKATAVERIAATLRIAMESILFVDDNPGELAAMSARLPQVHTIHAGPDAGLTRRVIEYFPGLWRWRSAEEDTRRIRDLGASTEREALRAKATDPRDYFRSLRVSLVYRYDPLDQLGRLADLVNKTTQFNLVLRRFNDVEIADRMRRADTCVASVQLTDRLADSGVIAVIVAGRVGATLIVEELCVSCRALGRQLEDTFILVAIRGMPQFAGCTTVAFRAGHGPRNQPALAWLGKLLDVSEVPPGLHAVPAGQFLNFAPVEGVSLTIS